VKDVRLRALSFNIRGALGRDGRRDLGRIARIVRDLGAHIAALQEVDSRVGPYSAEQQAQMLEARTGLRAIAGPTLLRSDRHYGNLLLTAHPVLALDRIDLGQPGREPRGAIDARLATPGGPLRVVATHLGLGLVERHRQLDRLLVQLRGDAGPTLLMGDFNEWVPGLGILPRIHALFPKRRTPRTFPAWWPLLALDRIWGLPGDLIESLRTPDDPIALEASDHRPLVATIRMSRG
jgi:endonuclease/exonuclease/phosphatase family metal-dependent hydrolase